MTRRINWFEDRGRGEARKTAEAAALCPNPFSEISCSLYVSPLIYTLSQPSACVPTPPHPPPPSSLWDNMSWVQKTEAAASFSIFKSETITVTNTIAVKSGSDDPVILFKRGVCVSISSFFFFFFYHKSLFILLNKGIGRMSCCHKTHRRQKCVIKHSKQQEQATVRTCSNILAVPNLPSPNIYHMWNGLFEHTRRSYINNSAAWS